MSPSTCMPLGNPSIPARFSVSFFRSTFMEKLRPVPPSPLNFVISKSVVIKAKPVFMLNVPVAFPGSIFPPFASETFKEISACSVSPFASMSKAHWSSIGLLRESILKVVFKSFMRVSSCNW